MTERSRDRPFAAALLAWVLLSVGFWLAYYPLMERLTPATLALVGAAILVGLPLVLLVWAIWRAARRKGGWIAAPAVVVAAIALVGSGLILERASAYINFQAQKASYDAAVARAGPGPHLFLWQENPNLLIGVVYDPAGCEPPAARAGAPPGVRRQLEGPYCFVSEPRP